MGPPQATMEAAPMEDTGDHTLEATTVEAMEEAMADTGTDMARDPPRLNLATATLAMVILAMEVMEDTDVMDTDTIKRSQQHSKSSYCINIACCIHWKLF